MKLGNNCICKYVKVGQSQKVLSKFGPIFKNKQNYLLKSLNFQYKVKFEGQWSGSFFCGWNTFRDYPTFKREFKDKSVFLSTHTDMKHLRKNDFESWNFVRCNSSPDSLGSMSYFLLNVRVEYNFWPWIWSLSKSLYKNTDKVREINNN